MEETPYNNGIFNNAYDSFINGGPQTVSGSSSSAASSNGTPSHSYKGSVTPSSPSSDELSAGTVDLHSMQPNQLPYGAAVSLSKKVTNCNLMPDGRVPRSTNVAERVSATHFSAVAQNAENSSGLNENMYQSTTTNTSLLDGISEMNSSAVSKNLPNNRDGSQVNFPGPYSQTPSLLPSSIPRTQTSVASYFNNVPATMSATFPTSSPVPLKSPPVSATSYVSQSNMFPPNTAAAVSSTARQPTYAPYIPPQNSVPAANHSQKVVEPVAYPLQKNPISAFSQFSKPIQGHQNLLVSSTNAPMPPAVSHSQGISHYSTSQTVMTSSRPAFSPTLTGPFAPNPAAGGAYKNVMLHDNSQAYSASHPSYAERSPLQSPMGSKLGGEDFYRSENQNVPAMADKQMYPAYGQVGQLKLSGQDVVQNQPRLNNQMYPINGSQSPYYAAQDYGSQYPSVPQQMSRRYPGNVVNDPHQVDAMSSQFGGLNVTKQGFYGAKGIESCDLLRMRDILPKQKIQAPSIPLPPELPADCNCSPDLFRCTLTKIPETKSLLDKSRLPLGILLHPFRDLTNLSVIQCSTIVRCRSCRTYINPFVYFMDNRHWKCNLCFRANDLPDDFRYNPMTKMHDDPLRRPEVQTATIEFIASSEYMVRPPPPAIYVFIFDVSRIATQTGYLSTVCEVLSANLGKLPGDARTSVGFIAVDSAIRFYELGENTHRPHELIVTDVDDVFIPSPENLIVNLHEQFELVKDLLEHLPEKFKESYDTNCAFGAALVAAHKLMASVGGRVTVFLSCLPNYGPGALKPREEPSQRADNNVNLNPATDFYKKLALECNGVHVAIDLFIVNAQFVDLATISGISQVSGGCMHHFPLYSYKNTKDIEKLVNTFERYLTRKIGFESVMRLRCTKGLGIHSFHGNCFVRTTDLLALPNINPDAGFGMQVSIDENLSDLQNVSFQAALLYTSSQGERRIRVHTLCLPVTNNLHDVLVSADQQCIAGLLAKLAVDRSLHSSVADAREAFVNAVCDIFNTYKMVSHSGNVGSLFAPNNLTLFPLYVLGLMKSNAFRLGPSTRTDDRVYAMYQMKCIPLDRLVQIIYPDLYPLHNITEQPLNEVNGIVVPEPPVIQLSAERVDSSGIYLLDDSEAFLIFICHNVSPSVCQNIFGYPQFSSIPENLVDFPILETRESQLVNNFINFLQSKKPTPAIVYILKDTNQTRAKFFERMVEDKTELGVSYYEFLQNVSSQLS